MDLNNETDVELNLKTDDVLTLCRCCLSRETDMLSLFSDSTNHVPGFFNQYLQIKVNAMQSCFFKFQFVFLFQYVFFF